MRPVGGGPPPVTLGFVESAGRSGRSVGRTGEFDTLGCMLATREGFDGGRSVPVVSPRPATSRGRPGSAETTVHAMASGEAGAYLVEASCLPAEPAAREALLVRLKTICDALPDPARDPPRAPGRGF